MHPLIPHLDCTIGRCAPPYLYVHICLSQSSNVWPYHSTKCMRKMCIHIRGPNDKPILGQIYKDKIERSLSIDGQTYAIQMC